MCPLTLLLLLSILFVEICPLNNYVKVVKKSVITNNYHESDVLMLNSNKAKKLLNWKPKYNLNETVKLIVEWQNNYLKKGNIFEISQQQLLNYLIKK